MKGLMKKTAFLLSLVLCFSLLPKMTITSQAAGDNTLYLNVTYNQTEARKMLDDINAFRASNDAWYWEQDNVTKRDLSGQLQPLTYDYGLEKIAMQRAVEVALNFDHTRPDGSSCFTAGPEVIGMDVFKGENLQAGTGSLGERENAMLSLREDNELWNGQGHRRQMLGPSNRYVGIGYVTYRGVGYWVQCFGQVSSNMPATAPVNKSQVASFKVADSFITSGEVYNSEGSLIAGKTYSKDSIHICVNLIDTFPPEGFFTVNEIENDYTVKSSDPSILEISNGSFICKKPGTVDLTFKVAETTLDFTINAVVEKGQEDPTPAPTPVPTPIPKEPKSPKVENGIYRLYKPSNGDHLFTTNYDEYKALSNNPKFIDEGLGFLSIPKTQEGVLPVYRLFNLINGEHFFTMNKKEYDTLRVRNTWDDEGIAFYCYDKNSTEGVPMYRFHNPRSTMHFFTINEDEANNVKASPTWKYEGIFGRVGAK